MKYIKFFKTFETVSKEEYRLLIEEVLDTIDDIALELNDIGLDLNYGGSLLTISITKKYKYGFGIGTRPFNLDSTVTDVILRLYQYLVGFNFIKFKSITLNSTKAILQSSGNRARDFFEFTDIFDFEEFSEKSSDLMLIGIKMEFPEIR